MKTFASDRPQARLIIPWAKKACIRFHILAAMNACLHFGLSVEGTVNFLNLLNFLNFSDLNDRILWMNRCHTTFMLV